MNATPQRAREACEVCRRKHKRCEFDGHSGCPRCVRSGVQCSLFIPGDATAAAHQGTLASVATELPAPAPWDGIGAPHDTSSPTSPQEGFYWGQLVADALGGQYPADMIFQTPLANEDRSEQPAMPQGGAYYDQNVFNDHDGT